MILIVLFNLFKRLIIKYFLFCRKNTQFVSVDINDAQLSTKLDNTLPVGILIHGWIDSTLSGWMAATSKDWVKYGNTNVCMVDWSRLSFAGYVLASLVNTKIVGYYVTQFIQGLVTNGGFKLADVTIAGHSLGGQISGYVGRNLNGQVGKIFGLDPAGPLFTIPVVRPPSEILDPTDAVFVQVIHTSSGLLGAQIKCGHQDFYPNKGVVPQVGCQWPGIGDRLFPEAIVCAHFRAYEYFHYALNPANNFSGIQCSSLAQYNSRSCSSTTDLLGIHTAQ